MGREESPAPIVSLDQFRGYTVVGMFLVNFAAGFAVLPETIHHHHTHFSYADSIMPQFFFAVGFALRLVLFRRWEMAGSGTAPPVDPVEGRSVFRELEALTNREELH